MICTSTTPPMIRYFFSGSLKLKRRFFSSTGVSGAAVFSGSFSFAMICLYRTECTGLTGRLRNRITNTQNVCAFELLKMILDGGVQPARRNLIGLAGIEGSSEKEAAPGGGGPTP